MNPRTARILPILALAAPLIAAVASSRTSAPILDRAVEHHGGDRYRTSETSLRLCSKGGCFEVRARVDGDRYDHTVQGRAGDVDRTVRITNDTVERSDDGRPVPLAGADVQKMRDWAMARVYFPFLPYRLHDASVRHHDRGLERWDGRPLHRVKVTFEAGTSTDDDDEYTYWLDPETGRVEQLAYTYSGQPGGLRFRRATNHRRVGGILFFDQENYGVEGDGLSVDRIDPAFADTLRHVSTLTLEAIVVRPIKAQGAEAPP